MRAIRTYLSAALFLAFGSASAWAQATAAISGAVTNQNGAPIGGAIIKATQTATGAVRSAVTLDNGEYSLPNLPIGPYMIEATFPGFKTYAQTGIVLQVSSTPTLNIMMRVGDVNQTIDVKEDAAMVETTGTGVGTVIDNKSIDDLPLNGRVPTQLIFLAGMSQPGAQSTLVSQRNYPTMLAISVAGGTGEGVVYMLDGVNHNDAQNNLSFVMPFPDALQEFKVESSALPAQYGYHSDAVVTAITKSGTNQFHGDLFEYIRNGDFNARNFFAPARDTLKRNQFGGVIGGPVKRDKLFFFVGYQRTSNRSNPPTTIAYVPTPAMIAGDFSTFASPACNGGRQINLSAAAGFVNNQISPSLFNPVAMNILKLLPAATNGCGQVQYGLRANTNEDILVGRTDYVRSLKSSFFARFEVANLFKTSSYNGTNPLTIASPASNFSDKALALGYTYVFSPSMVNSFHASVTRSDVYNPDDVFKSWADVGVKNFSEVGGKMLALAVSGNGFTITGNLNNNPTGPNANFADDVNWILGRHQIAFGGAYMHTIFNQIANYGAHGSATFNGSVTGLSQADFLLGTASAWSQANLYAQYTRQNYIGLYIQDTWKIKQRLTLNYGVRWEPSIAPYDAQDRFDTFDAKLFAQNVHSSRFPSGPAGLIFNGDKEWDIGNAPNNSTYKRFYPRVGLAWDVFGNGKMAVRSAYGMFSVLRPLGTYIAFTNDSPWGDLVSLANVNISNPWASYPGGNPFPYVVGKNTTIPLYSSYSGRQMHQPTSYQNQWNLDIERQIGKDWLLSASYLGNNTIHLVVPVQRNPAVFLGTGACNINGISYGVCSTTTNTNQRRQLYLQNPSQGQYYAQMTIDENLGSQSYHGLLLKVQKRLSKGVSLLTNYTLSHCISYPFDFTQGSGVNADQIRAFRSNCPTGDLRNVFNLSSVIQSPRLSGNGWLQKLGSNWQLSPIVTLRSGSFFSVTTGVDNALTGQPNQVPLLVGNPYPATKSIAGWINTAAFQSPATGTLGNLGLNSLRGPGYFSLDAAVSRVFSFQEGKHTVQIRADGFNLPNHVNYQNPIATTNSGSFGKILTAGDPRILQFAIKYVF